MMFVVFGWGPRVKDLGPDRERDCPNCHNRRVWQRWEQTNWITLFFIPVIPTGRKRLRQCPICSFGYEE
jgi:hypothetical protein